MAEAYYLAIVCLLILSLYGIDARRREKRRKFILKERMPAELSEGQLIRSEHYIRTEVPRKMHGTLDQLYRVLSGLHVLVDSKTRDKHQVFMKDIVQVSVYRVILIRTGVRMADYAYFRVVTPDGIEYHKRTLLDEAQVIDEFDRTQTLINGKATPSNAQHKAMCMSCPQQINCDDWQFSGRHQS
ncbi:hypothetical protein [Methylophaga pinxianii]|uniref:hypothetical protein n=1 Tax=Methylophaga pinxianii TaxID=2881052 RepID=UPI001CF223B3|nr:hypothetical protein [Methylophaga pinxianii]MCB2425743.1 hypothetical protein [Methylophaga pinxianii]UPH47315.1 hypothetical protein LGT42_014850 [Methylophaga pinxianii]